MSSNEQVSVRILDREYLIACAANERESLLAAATHLDQRMRDLRTSTRIAGLDRIAVLAALNISHELIAQRDQHAGLQDETSTHIDQLTNKLEAALATPVE